MTRLRFILAALLLLFLAACEEGGDKLAGGGGVDVEGITVEGTAMRADRSPVVGALVRIRPWDYSGVAALPKIAVDHGDMHTDSLGRFRFDHIDTGRYAVEVDGGNDGATVLEIDADGSKPVLELEAMVQPSGMLTGTVRDAAGPAAGATVSLLGLDRSAQTDSAGRFVLAALPPGTYTVQVAPATSDWSSIEIPQVAVNGDGQTALDSIVLPSAVPGLLAYWRFDEGKGSVAGNAEGTDARAELKGSCSWESAKIGTGLAFRDSGYAFVPKTKSASLDIKAGADYTVTMWIKTHAAGSGSGSPRHAADTRTAYAPMGWSIGLAENGAAEFLHRSADEKADARLSAGPALDDGGWHLIAAGRSGTRWFLYVDGVQQSEAQGSSDAVTQSNPLFFGANEGKADFFPGLIDDVRLYPRGLTADEAKAILASAL